MTPICSVLIPSRGRCERLCDSIKSVLAAAKNPDQIETLVRLDFDDPDLFVTLTHLWAFNDFKNVKVIVGPRMNGYKDVHLMYSELARLAKGRWCWIWNDDVTLEGCCWDDKLSEVAEIGFIVQTERHKLNQSEYGPHDAGPFPIVPTRCWEQLGWKELPHPIDINLDKLLRIENGWQTHFLKDLTVWHQRDDDKQLDEHRK